MAKKAADSSISGDSGELKDLLDRLRADRSNLFGPRATAQDVKKLEERLGVTFPQNHVEFLKEFDGGQFGFARMHCITESGAGWHDMIIELERFFSHAPLMGVRSLLPFGSSYGGDVFCFDMANKSEDDAPIVMYDHEGSENQELTREAPSLLSWIKDHYDGLDDDPFSIRLFLASDVDLSDLKDKCKGEKIVLTPFGDDEYPVRIYLAGRKEFKYQVTMADDWQGFRAKDVPAEEKNSNAKQLKNLSEVIHALVEKTGEPLELFVFSSGEMSSLQQFKIVVGTIEILKEKLELKAGDHFEIVPEGRLLKVPPAELENRVEQPVKSTELSCSFCGLTQSEVKKLIAGPGCLICDQCVDLCADIIAEEAVEE